VAKRNQASEKKAAMTETTPSPLGKVIKIDDASFVCIAPLYGDTRSTHSAEVRQRSPPREGGPGDENWLRLVILQGETAGIVRVSTVLAHGEWIASDWLVSAKSEHPLPSASGQSASKSQSEPNLQTTAP
jgi:hypothetical protein